MATMSSPSLDIKLTAGTERRLNALIDAAELLGIDELSFSSYSQELIKLSSERLHLKQSLNRTEFALTELETHLAEIEHEKRLFDSWRCQLDNTNHSADLLERKRQTLHKKAKEYTQQLSQITLEEPPVTISDLTAQETRNRETEERIRVKRGKLEVFQGLPPDMELARSALQRAIEEQASLIQKREQLLTSMAESVS